MSVAYAQQGPTRDDVLVEEIIVTSRKIEENLRDVPLSITALTSGEIERANIQGLDDIADFTPGLSFFNPIGEFLPTPVIRGIAPTDIFGGLNVSSFVDGVFVAGREGLNFSLLEVERIEIVKGPQSTMYGRRSFSGAINYVTRRPSNEFESKVDVTAGNDGRIAGKAIVGGPIIRDVLAGRITLAYDDFDGSYDDPLGGNDVGGREYKTAIGTLNWTPNEDLDLLFNLFYSEDEIDIGATTSLTTDCEDVSTLDPDPATNGGAFNFTDTRFGAYCGEIPDVGQVNQDLGISDDKVIRKAVGAIGEERELLRGSLNVDWDVGDGTLTFLTGYSRTEQTSVDDGTRNLGNDQAFEYCQLNLGSQSLCTTPLITRTGQLQPNLGDDTEEWSQEIRFTSNLENEFRYSIGGYYFNTEFTSADGGVIHTVPPPATAPGSLGIAYGPFIQIGPAGPFVAIGTDAFAPWFQPGGDLADNVVFNTETDDEGWAIFSWAELDVAEKFTFRAELRYSDVESETRDTRTEFTPTGTLVDIDTQKGSWDEVTGRLSLQYRISDEWQVYGSVANGTKPGDFDILSGDISLAPGDPCPLDPNDPEVNFASCSVARKVTVEPEDLVMYEIGAKGATLNGRLRLDLAMYYGDWQDIVLRNTLESDPVTGLPFDQPEGTRFNGGDADVWGWEASGLFVISDNLTGSLGLSFTDAKWGAVQNDKYVFFPSYGDASCRNTTPGQPLPPQCGNIQGNQVSRQPQWQGNLSLTYSRAFAGDWQWFTRGDLTYRDEYFPEDDNLATLPSRTLVNLKLGVTSERYDFEIWAKNLFEEDSPSASFRDVYFGNTSDFSGTANGGSPNNFFPFRYTVTHPTLRTYGVTARVRFGAAR
ncbi:MAG: TonB-dependent receptor [Gammaproteobacteria bacterium]|nr:TonB-dependent receptor [Gammaproteobacteria bacterium]